VNGGVFVVFSAGRGAPGAVRREWRSAASRAALNDL